MNCFPGGFPCIHIIGVVEAIIDCFWCKYHHIVLDSPSMITPARDQGCKRRVAINTGKGIDFCSA
jgi:hypothetical protein